MKLPEEISTAMVSGGACSFLFILSILITNDFFAIFFIYSDWLYKARELHCWEVKENKKKETFQLKTRWKGYDADEDRDECIIVKAKEQTKDYLISSPHTRSQSPEWWGKSTPSPN